MTPSDTPMDELLLILSEECAELIQASSKIIRSEHGDNFVATSDKLWGNLVEELADVQVMIDTILIKHPELRSSVEDGRVAKTERWIRRLNRRND